ncbi:hypothetical protein [Burkholderia ubonensis]|uniref:hypothetical protein n=1 Tax=Burkholderia ubonensis TaxID=101571 RepID=UPI000B1FFE59|nr:hypothetical protein [Burkholderia ubonensis]
MSRAELLDSQFRALHRTSYEEYSEKIRKIRDDNEFISSSKKLFEERERDAIYRVSQMSPDDYAKIDQEQQDAIKGHVQQVRSKLIARQSKEAQLFKQRAVLNGLEAQRPISIPIFASSVMSDSASEVADIPGEHGNPWVLPWNPDKVKVSRSISGSEFGLCGMARPEIPSLVVDFWFAFLADTTGVWNFMALIDSFGFYLLNANRGFLLCRDSRATVSASLNAYQYFWFGEKQFPIIDIDSDTGFKYGFIDEYGNYDYQAFLRDDPNSYVFLRARISISVDAYGYGSWAEINFKDGDANFIKPLLLIAYQI